MDSIPVVELDEAAKALHVKREAFIERAIRRYVRYVSRRSLRNQLLEESAMTAEESLGDLKEFEAVS